MKGHSLDEVSFYVYAKLDCYQYNYDSMKYANFSTNAQSHAVNKSDNEIQQKELPKSSYYDSLKKRYYLGSENFDNVYLTAREIAVFKKILLGYSARQIGEVLNISPKTVEGYSENIKNKLQVKTKGEIISTAIYFDLIEILHLNTAQ